MKTLKKMLNLDFQKLEDKIDNKIKALKLVLFSVL